MKLTVATATLSALVASSSVLGFVPAGQSQQRSKTSIANDLFDGNDEEKVSDKKEMSKALPFVPRPKLLDGTLAGDVGFE